VKPRLVLSGVNLVEAGPLSIFQDALRELSLNFAGRYDIIALVHRRDLFSIPGIAYREFPRVKTSWLRRLWFEYVTCRALSRELHAHLWLSMHDITPSVTATLRAVYCHNPAPFYQLTAQEAKLDRTFALFCLLYRFLYGIGIANNHFVIVQQAWMREEFRRRYNVREVIVAHPSIDHKITQRHPEPEAKDLRILPEPPTTLAKPTVFLYPAFPRSFKNIELTLAAMQILESQGNPTAELWLTLTGEENPYAVSLRQRFGHLQNVRWLGFQTRTRILELYNEADCLVFPSRLESWGMPLSEFKTTGKPIFAADLPYAHETLGDYNSVCFFSPTDATALASALSHADSPATFAATKAVPIAQPFAENWQQLFNILLNLPSEEAAS